MRDVMTPVAATPEGGEPPAEHHASSGHGGAFVTAQSSKESRRIPPASTCNSSDRIEEWAGPLVRPAHFRDVPCVVPASPSADGIWLAADDVWREWNRLVLHRFIAHQMSHAMSVEPNAEAAPRSICLMRPDQARRASPRRRRTRTVHFGVVLKSFSIALVLRILRRPGGEVGQFQGRRSGTRRMLRTGQHVAEPAATAGVLQDSVQQA